MPKNQISMLIKHLTSQFCVLHRNIAYISILRYPSQNSKKIELSDKSLMIAIIDFAITGVFTFNI